MKDRTGTTSNNDNSTQRRVVKKDNRTRNNYNYNKPPVLDPSLKPLHLADLKTMEITKLEELAKEFGVENATSLIRQELIFELLNCSETFTCFGFSLFLDAKLDS